jgi:hypothetical protein
VQQNGGMNDDENAMHESIRSNRVMSMVVVLFSLFHLLMLKK